MDPSYSLFLMNQFSKKSWFLAAWAKTDVALIDKIRMLIASYLDSCLSLGETTKSTNNKTKFGQKNPFDYFSKK